MSNLRSHISSDKVKWIITAIVITLLVITVIGLSVKIFKNDKTDTVSTTFGYSVGAIDESSGKVVDSKRSIVMKDMQSVKDMAIEPSDTATAKYRVAFYDEDKTFISMTAASGDKFNDSAIPENAEYFRIMITPAAVDGEPVEISTFAVKRYAEMFNVSFGK